MVKTHREPTKPTKPEPRYPTLTKQKRTDIQSPKKSSFNEKIQTLINSGVNYLRSITELTNRYLIVNSNGNLLNYQIDEIYCLNLARPKNTNNFGFSIIPSFVINFYCKIDGMIGYQFLNGTPEMTDLTDTPEMTDLTEEDKKKHVFVLQSINCDIITESSNPLIPNAKVERRIKGMGLNIFENPDGVNISEIQFTDNENRIKLIQDNHLSLIKIALYYGNFHDGVIITHDIKEMFKNPSSQYKKTCLVEDDNSPSGFTTGCLISGGYKHRKSKKYRKYRKYRKSRKTNKRKTNKK